MLVIIGQIFVLSDKNISPPETFFLICNGVQLNLFVGLLSNILFSYFFKCILAILQYVDKDFGTGVLKISPGHDHNDYLLARKLGLPILNVMNKDGTLNDVAGLYW